jgi:hypothetical protein
LENENEDDQNDESNSFDFDTFMGIYGDDADLMNWEFDD